MTSLERGYRRLIRVYPAAWRAEREEELVGVLLDRAADGQRHPRPGEAADLLVHGLAARAGALLDPRAPWGQATGIVGVLLLLALTLAGLRALAGLAFLAADLRQVLASGFADPGWHGPRGLLAWLNLTAVDWPVRAGWVLVAGLVLARRGRTARWAALGAVAGHAVLLAQLLRAGDPVDEIDVAWLATGLLAACALARPEPVARLLDRIGRGRALAVLTVAAALTAITRYLAWLPDVDPDLAAAGTLAEWLLVALALAGGAFLLHTPGGRRALPVLAAVVAAFAAPRLPLLATTAGLGAPFPVVPPQAAAAAVPAVVVVLATAAVLGTERLAAGRRRPRAPG